MPFLTLYFIIALLAINNDKVRNIRYLDLFIFALLILISSIRWEVGGDWGPYGRFYDNLFIWNKSPLDSSLFYIIHAFSNLINLNFLGKNIVLIILFLFPFYYVFKKFYKNIYLSLCIFFPIIFLIYGLGSIRQGLAISYFYLFLYYNGNKFIKYSLFIIPFFFHLSAIFLMIFYLFSQIISFDNFKIFIKKLLLISFLIFFILIISYDIWTFYIVHYVDDKIFKSSGAVIRALFLSFFCVIYLIKFRYNDKDSFHKFLFLSSIFIILITPLSFYFSTPIDRLLGFFLFLKIIISDELLKIVDKSKIKIISLVLILMSFSYLVIWLYFGNNSWQWLDFEIHFI
tara:strand:+ start:95 stop:1123 length:1029 start_codon:yes stop_codon:yes gene_type:complete